MSATDLEPRAIVLCDTADSLDVVDSETLAAAGAFLREIKEYRRLVADAFDGMIEKARATWQEALAQKRRYEEPAEEAERNIKAKIGAYHAEEERKAREETERQRAEAKRAAEEEALKRAQEAEESGFGEAVDEILSNPPTPVPVIPVKSAAAKTAGVSVRTTWKYTIVDEKVIPREYMVPDHKKIGAVVRATRDRTNIPGVSVFPDKSVAARS